MGASLAVAETAPWRRLLGRISAAFLGLDDLRARLLDAGAATSAAPLRPRPNVSRSDAERRRRRALLARLQRRRARPREGSGARPERTLIGRALVNDQLRRADEDEEALAFRAIFDATVIGHVHADLAAGVILRCNCAFAEMAGLTREELTGRPLSALLDPGDVEALNAGLEAIRADPLSHDARDHRLVRPDGASIWVRISMGSTGPDARGRRQIVALVENVEGRRRVLERLETANMRLEKVVQDRTKALARVSAQENILRSILDTGPDAMVMVDPFGRISMFSPAAERLFGWSAEEAVGRHVAFLMPSSYPDYDETAGWEEISAPAHVLGVNREVTGRRRDGSAFPMMLYVGRVDIGGERHLTKFVRDLTPQREAAQEAEELQGQLSQLWGLNSLGEMAAVLAHELNQPLAAIANYVHGVKAIVARLELPDDSALEALDAAISQTLRAGEIIRRMRTMIASNDSAKEVETLNPLITELDFMIELVARDKSAMVLYNLVQDQRPVFVDRIQIQQVILNLIRNAVEEMSVSPTRILEVAARPEADCWIVSIDDSGPGIAPAIADRLFAPLASTKREGMGLGLSLSKSIIENHGGRIWLARSKLGGACFCFSLPFAAEPGAQPSGRRR